MTRLISNSTRSSWAASTDGGIGEPPLAGELSIGVLAALLTGLPGRAGPRFPGRPPSTGRQTHPSVSVLHVPGGTLVRRALDCASSGAGNARPHPLPGAQTGC